MRSQKSRIILIVMIVSLALTAVAPTAVVAQENETSTPQTPDPPTDTPEPTETSNSTQYQLQINDDTRIVNSSWDRGTVTFVVESDISQLIVVTDSSIDMQAQKAGEVPQLHTAVPKGRSKISFTVQNPREAVVTVNSKKDLIFLSPGRGSSTIIGGPWTVSDARAAGVGTALGISIVTMFIVLRRIRSPAENGERIA